MVSPWGKASITVICDFLLLIIYNSIPNMRGLEDHVATLTDYINAYSHASTLKAKDDIFKNFSQHIVTRCWPKMWRRIDSWISKGIIYMLINIPEATIRYAFSKYQKLPQEGSKRTDYGFSTTFTQMVKHGLVKEILKAHPSPGGKLDHLTAVLAKAVKSEEKKQKQKEKEERKGGRKVEAEAEAEAEAEEPIILYNAQTCTEFHKFLVAILCAYGYALAEFSKSVTNQLAFKTQREKAIKFWDIAIMLWKTAHSQILQQHLTALQLAGSLSLPTFSDRDTYEAFFNWKEGKGKGKEKGKGQVEDDIDCDDGEEDSDSDALTRILHEAEQNSQHPPEQSHPENLLAYRRCLRILCNHFVSLDILSKYCNRSGSQRIEISLLAVDQPGPAKAILEWPSVIRKLGPHSQPKDVQLPGDGGLDVEAAIKVLQENIRPVATDSSAGANQNPSGPSGPAKRPARERGIRNAFFKGPVYFSKVHCELALASARAFPQLVSMDRDLLATLIVRP
jgi:hypothetical protein